MQGFIKLICSYRDRQNLVFSLKPRKEPLEIYLQYKLEAYSFYSRMWRVMLWSLTNTLLRSDVLIQHPMQCLGKSCRVFQVQCQHHSWHVPSGVLSQGLICSAWTIQAVKRKGLLRSVLQIARARSHPFAAGHSGNLKANTEGELKQIPQVLYWETLKFDWSSLLVCWWAVARSV